MFPFTFMNPSLNAKWEALPDGGFRIEYFRTLDAKRQGEENGGLETAGPCLRQNLGRKKEVVMRAIRWETAAAVVLMAVVGSSCSSSRTYRSARHTHHVYAHVHIVTIGHHHHRLEHRHRAHKSSHHKHHEREMHRELLAMGKIRTLPAHSNRGGEVRGRDRADEVHEMNEERKHHREMERERAKARHERSHERAKHRRELERESEKKDREIKREEAKDYRGAAAERSKKGGEVRAKERAEDGKDKEKGKSKGKGKGKN